MTDYAFAQWCDHMLREHRLGPGCGHAEFEGDDWREQVRWRMDKGIRPGLAKAFREWAAKAGEEQSK